MSEDKPSPVTYHEYDIPSLNTIFAWSSALLLLVSVWMIWADYNRSWKDYHRRFNDIEIARTRKAMADAGKSVDQKAMAAVTAQLAEGEKQRTAQRAEIDRLEKQIDGLAGKWYSADQAYKFIKGELDVARYELETAKQHQHGIPAAQAKFDRILAETEQRRLAFEQVDGERTAATAALAKINQVVTDAEKQRESLLAEQTRLAKRLEKIGHDGPTGLVNDYFRDRPLVDFLAPAIKVQQVVLPNLHEDVNFLTVPRVDRCHTCHLAADKPGFTGKELPAEFRTHPRYEELIAKHPVERFGCTGCHAGGGRSIEFIAAAHTPRDEKQAKLWEERFDWERLHHWDFPMLPLQYAEAGCANCHKDQARVPGANKLNQGRELMEQYGCNGCHKIDRPGYDELRKAGPDLSHISAKVTRDWMYKWVSEPKSFRPSTRMPRFWGNSNTAKATARMNYPLRDKVEAEAVVRYMRAKATPYPALAEAPRGLSGDPTRGKWVVDNRGCKACHVVGAGDTGEGRAGAHFGPELNQVGSKLSAQWLYAWVLDPKALWPNTRMPNLRLSEQEALDAAAYLLTLKNTDFEGRALPDLAGAEVEKMLADVTLEYLRKQTTVADAQTRLGQMDEEARYQYLGGKLIGRYGCFGCHEGIGGFENAQRIGTELTTWASKLLTQLDFALRHDVPHTRHDWLKAKLLNTRGFDEGKTETKDPQDLLRMPNFEFTPQQIDLIATNVMSLQRDFNQPAAHFRLGPEQVAMEKGRRVIDQSNCRGCHIIENQGGGMEKVLEGGKPFAPPMLVMDFKTLDGRKGRMEEGAKVQPDWLFGFLKEPTIIRPWFNVRMPSFGLSDTDATDIVRYFAYHAGESFPYSSFDPTTLADQQVAVGQKLFEQYKCVSCHLPLEEAKKLGISVEMLAPNLELTKSRLKYSWLYAWLKDPGAIQKDTKMPSFFYGWDEDAKKYVEAMPDPDPKMEAIRAYLQFHGAPAAEGRLAAARGRK